MLILALVMGSFSMVFGSAPGDGHSIKLTDVKGLPGEEQILVNQHLGIIEGYPDGTFKPEGLVNRAEFAAMITRAMGIPESALVGYTTTSFLDTAGYSWAIKYLAFCQARGIMIGDGYGNAMPGRTISVNEAMTMILRAIGYTETSEELIGRWPANYVTLARQEFLYDDLVGTEVYMDRQNAAIALYNALVTQLVYVDLEGRTTKRWVGPLNDEIPATLANTGLDCDTVRGVIDDTYYGLSYINVTDKLGGYGLIFTTRSEGELVAFKQSSTFITGTTTSSGRFESSDTGALYSFGGLDLVTGAAFAFFNGEYDKTYFGTPVKVIEDFTEEGDRTDGEEVTLSVRLTGNTIREIYAFVGWAATEAAVVDNAEIATIENDQELLGGEFGLDNSLEIDDKQFGLVGADDLGDINSGDVVYIYENGDGVIRKVAVGTETVEGGITESNHSLFIIDGKKYWYASKYLAEGPFTATTADEIEGAAGSDAVVLLDAYGYAYDIDVTGGNFELFGINLASRITAASVDGNRILMFNSEDEEISYPVVAVRNLTSYEPRPYLGVDKTLKRTSSDVDDEWAGVQGNNANVGSLFGYRLNSAGSINVLEMASTPAAISVTRKGIVTVNDSGTYRDVILDPNAPVFNFRDDDWEVATVDDIKRDKYKSRTDTQPGQYLLNVRGDRVIALVLGAEYVGVTSDDVFGVVNVARNAASSSIALDGFFDGVKKEGTTAQMTVTSYGPAASSFNGVRKEVVFYQFTMNKDKLVTKAVDLVGDEFRNFTDPAVLSSGAAVNSGPAVQLWTERDTNQHYVNGTYFVKGFGTEIRVQADGAVIYEAKWSSGNVVYSLFNRTIPRGSWIWGFCTCGKDDVEDHADVLIFMSEEDYEKYPDNPAAAW